MATPRASWSRTHPGPLSLALSGSWNADHAAALETLIDKVVADKPKGEAGQRLVLECGEIVGLDTLGAYLVHKVRTLLADGGLDVLVHGLKP